MNLMKGIPHIYFILHMVHLMMLPMALDYIYNMELKDDWWE
jgi:hypothetical protein